MPYAYGCIEGKGFAIQWICELLDVNIFIWNIETKDIFLRFYSSNTCSRVLHLMNVPIATSHAHLTNLNNNN